MTSMGPHQPGDDQRHPPAPPPAPGLGGPGYAEHAVHVSVGDPGLASAPTRSRLGLVALILGCAAVALNLLIAMVQAGLIASGSFSAISVVAVLRTVLVGLLALSALIVGGIALARRGAPKALAGIGVGIGIALTVDVIATALYTTIAVSVGR